MKDLQVIKNTLKVNCPQADSEDGFAEIENKLQLLAIYEKCITIKDYGGTKIISGSISDEDYEKIRKLRKV